MRLPGSPFNFLLFVFALAFLLAFIQVGVITIAFDKLGLSQSSAFLLLFASLGGSLINLPLFSMRSDAPPAQPPPAPWRLGTWPQLPFTGRTVVAINTGGGLIPIAFSAYLLNHYPIPAGDALWGIGLVSLLSYLLSRPIPGLGIGMPMLIAPLSAALAAVWINPGLSAPLAYVSGTLGVLIGADLLRLKDIRQLGAPVAAIGGAGTFDGIFITGIVAVLLA